MRNNKGFTLIELVVVIVILGILMLLIIPRVGEFQRNAEIRTCQGNQRTYGSAQAMYYSSYRTTATTAAALQSYTGTVKPVNSTCQYSINGTINDPYVWTCGGNSGTGYPHAQ